MTTEIRSSGTPSSWDTIWAKIVRARNAIQTGGYDDDALLDPVLAPLSVDLGDGSRD